MRFINASILTRFCEKNTIFSSPRVFNSTFTKDQSDRDEFRVLDLMRKSKPKQREAMKYEIKPERASEMPVDQDWPSVWPGPRTFHPATVPLPLRQGYVKKGAPPDKYANPELMKIPNFLHLTPPAVKRHCEALKQFCTKWPEELNMESKCTEHFPIEVITSDYCYSSPTIREPLARIVSLRIKLSSLNLDSHAKDKFLRLVGNRYNPETDYVTITADRCPTRKQNLDYVFYLLTAVFHESWRVEAWESEKSEADMEYYNWDKSKSRQNLLTIHCWPAPPTNDVDIASIPAVSEYKVAITELIDNGEKPQTIEKYKTAVEKLFGLKSYDE